MFGRPNISVMIALQGLLRLERSLYCFKESGGQSLKQNHITTAKTTSCLNSVCHIAVSAEKSQFRTGSERYSETQNNENESH